MNTTITNKQAKRKEKRKNVLPFNTMTYKDCFVYDGVLYIMYYVFVVYINLDRTMLCFFMGNKIDTPDRYYTLR